MGKLTRLISVLIFFFGCQESLPNDQSTLSDYQSDQSGQTSAEQPEESQQVPEDAGEEQTAQISEESQPVDAEDEQDEQESDPSLFLSDLEFGELCQRLSEDTGHFPSDNFVSNETSYLHVSKALQSKSFEGRAYIGVGPEQNLTYIVMTKPKVAYIVDIRRGNMLEHMALRAVAEASETREAFLSRLTARPPSKAERPLKADALIEKISDRISKREANEKMVETNISDTIELMKRLNLPVKEGDRQTIEAIFRAFYKKGVNIAYSMEGSKRRYPKLRILLALRDFQGKQQSFLASEENYAYIRDFLKTNRLIPVIGDFAGEKSLKGVGQDIKSRSLKLGIFYTSNVEQYLFPIETYKRFIANVKSFPIDEETIFLRVWFDQGKAHPKQRRRHRTTSLVAPMEEFIERNEKRPFKNYWRVVTARFKTKTKTKTKR